MRAAIVITVVLFAGAAVPDVGLAQNVIGGQGRCKSLKVSGKDITKLCAGRILNLSYPDGRVGFYFVLKNGSIFTFSGLDQPNPTPDTDVVAIDKVIYGPSSAQPTVFAAFGRCSFGNYAKGHKTVTCRATAQDGLEYRGVFELTSPPSP